MLLHHRLLPSCFPLPGCPSRAASSCLAIRLATSGIWAAVVLMLLASHAYSGDAAPDKYSWIYMVNQKKNYSGANIDARFFQGAKGKLAYEEGIHPPTEPPDAPYTIERIDLIKEIPGDETVIKFFLLKSGKDSLLQYFWNGKIFCEYYSNNITKKGYNFRATVQPDDNLEQESADCAKGLPFWSQWSYFWPQYAHLDRYKEKNLEIWNLVMNWKK